MEASKGRLLIVDDELSVRDSLGKWFREEGYEMGTAENAQDALARLAEGRWDLALVDIKMRGTDGIELQRRMHEIDPEMMVIIMTGYASVETAVAALKNGAYDYVTKPLDPDDIAHQIQKALSHRKVERENVRLRETVAEVQRPPDLVGQSQAMQKVFDAIETVAPTDATVLITGESGTGKELVARAIHGGSPRKFQPLVAIHCGALTETLLESELFGYLKGSFTGANQNRRGLFEEATGGTVFLDEISEMSVGMQVKLLRVLQENAVRPLGSAAETAVDVRVIAATNRDLERATAEGNFREDLYYRLSVIPIYVPPLRERREDIPMLANYFLKKYAPAAGKSILRIVPDSLQALAGYEWPGNVRQLENTIERAVALCTGNELEVELPVERGRARTAAAGAGGAAATVNIPPDGMDMEGYVADLERALIQSALRQCNGVQTRAAEMLKLSYRSFRHLLKKYDL